MFKESIELSAVELTMRKTGKRLHHLGEAELHT